MTPTRPAGLLLTVAVIMAAMAVALLLVLPE